MTHLTPPPPKGYFYSIVPVTPYDFEDNAPLTSRMGFKLQLRKRRPFWFSGLVATVYVRADEDTLRVSIKTLDAAAAELVGLIERHQTYLESKKNAENLVKETNQSV